jgi:hypothetical protein
LGCTLGQLNRSMQSDWLLLNLLDIQNKISEFCMINQIIPDSFLCCLDLWAILATVISHPLLPIYLISFFSGPCPGTVTLIARLFHCALELSYCIVAATSCGVFVCSESAQSHKVESPCQVSQEMLAKVHVSLSVWQLWIHLCIPQFASLCLKLCVVFSGEVDKNVRKLTSSVSLELNIFVLFKRVRIFIEWIL